MPPELTTWGSGPVPCVAVAPVGSAYTVATTPPSLAEHLTLHVLVPTAPTVAGVAEEVAAAVAGVGGPAVVFGHSMNGTLALAAAAAAPASVRGVVAVASPPVLPPDPDVANRWWEATAEPGRRARFAELMAAADAAGDDDERHRHWRAAAATRRWFEPDVDRSALDDLVVLDGTWVQSVMADGALHDWPAVHAGVTAPVLLCLGRSDHLVPPTSWDGVELPGAERTVEVFDRSGHTPQHEEPEAFAAVLTSWLTTLR